MLLEERIEIILDKLDNEGSVVNTELVKLLNSSESTVRRDLSYLEEKGLLKRVHGGAVKVEKTSLEKNLLVKKEENIEAKKVIGKKASKLLKNDEIIFLDAGTTTYELIPYLKDRNIIVVTNGLMHLNKLMRLGVETYLLGGKIKTSTGVVKGPISLENLKKFNFDKAFLGANGIHKNSGYTTSDPDEVAIKKKVSKQSLTTYYMVDSSKFSQIYFLKIEDLKNTNLITDVEKNKVPTEIRKSLKLIGE